MTLREMKKTLTERIEELEAEIAELKAAKPEQHFHYHYTYPANGGNTWTRPTYFPWTYTSSGNTPTA